MSVRHRPLAVLVEGHAIELVVPALVEVVPGIAMPGCEVVYTIEASPQ